MGFGWLFLGYFGSTFMTLNHAGSLFRCLGYGVIFGATKKLRRYCDAFRMMEIGTILMFAVSALLATADVTDFLYRQLLLDSRWFGDTARTVIGYVYQALSVLFQVSMLYAVRVLAKETEVKKISDNAIRNFVFLCMYCAVYVANLVIRVDNLHVSAALTGAVWILYLACIVLNHLLIFSCYARICDEEDVDMEQKPSRFAFVNRFREKTEQRRTKGKKQ